MARAWRGASAPYGVQFNVGRDYTQGSQPVRTLIDLATIELVGRGRACPTGNA